MGTLSAEIFFGGALHDANNPTTTTVTDVYVALNILITIVVPDRRWWLLAEQLVTTRSAAHDLDDLAADELAFTLQHTCQG